MTNERIEKAIEDGARRWTKEGYDRLSNAEGGRILDTKVYYDLTTDRVSVKGSTYYHREALLEAAKEFFA